MRSIVLGASLMAFALAGCKPTLPSPPADAAATSGKASARATAQRDAPADDNLNAVLWMQRSAEYQALTTTIFRAAADRLDVALQQKNWDALVPTERDNAGKTSSLEPAVVMDVDETVLDNSPYQARLIIEGKQYDEVSWDRWVSEKKAKAVPGAVDFARAAAAKGIAIVYLSNRAVHLKDATIANLRAVGMPVAGDQSFLGLGTVVKGCEQNGSEKDCRRRLAGRQYRVLMQFGDQLGDFVQVIANTPDGRAGLLDDYRDWFGERWWMLPNPTYGSWEPALFNNDWQQPRAAQRQAKRQALNLGGKQINDLP